MYFENELYFHWAITMIIMAAVGFIILIVRDEIRMYKELNRFMNASFNQPLVPWYKRVTHMIVSTIHTMLGILKHIFLKRF
jgi:hypothetical protein